MLQTSRVGSEIKCGGCPDAVREVGPVSIVMVDKVPEVRGIVVE